MKETREDKEYREWSEDHDMFLRRAYELRPKEYKETDDHRPCKVCNLWVHPDMLTCQPCGGAKPIYSMTHKFQ